MIEKEKFLYKIQKQLTNFNFEKIVNSKFQFLPIHREETFASGVYICVI